MKTVTLTYYDIKQSDITDVIVERTEKGEPQLTFGRRKKVSFFEIFKPIALKGLLLAGIVLSIVGVISVMFGGISTISDAKEESFNKAVEEANTERTLYEQRLIEKVESDKLEKELSENEVVYYTKDDVQCTGIYATLAHNDANSNNNDEFEDKLYIPPYVDTSFKAYMDYRSITDTTSEQYKMQQNAWTGMDGVRRIGDDICVALGTYYTDGCGERFEITLDTGKTFTAIVSDIKDDRDTDETNRYTLHDEGTRACIVEFVVDIDEIGEKAQALGDISCNNFKGEVVSIVKL